jgi:hypothetical protein
MSDEILGRDRVRRASGRSPLRQSAATPSISGGVPGGSPGRIWRTASSVVSVTVPRTAGTSRR